MRMHIVTFNQVTHTVKILVLFHPCNGYIYSIFYEVSVILATMAALLHNIMVISFLKTVVGNSGRLQPEFSTMVPVLGRKYY